MSDFDKILELNADSKIELAESFKHLLNTELMFGQSRYVCRNGTLSDGHERITDAQRYYASIKEMYARYHAVEGYKADAMEAQADLMDANAEAASAVSPSDKLRADAKVLRSKTRLRAALENTEDTMRQMDEFNNVRLELQDKVRAQYPLGIEQAEKDNWEAVAKHRSMIENVTRVPQNLRHIPLDMESKAKLGVLLHKPEMFTWLAVEKQDEIQELAGGSITKYLGFEVDTKEKIALVDQTSSA